MGTKAIVKFKILSHFIKGKNSWTPMETILIILGELEYLEGLVKLARRKKDVERHMNHVTAIHTTPTIRRVNVNMAHHSKTLHLLVEINQTLIEGLVDTRASMLVIIANVVRELGIMHLVVGHETYKITSRLVTHALRRIIELLVKVGRIVLVIDIDSYDLFRGLDFLMKIGTIMDVEKGVI